MRSRNSKHFPMIIFLISGILGLSSCYDEPEYDLTPHLTGFDGDDGVQLIEILNTVVDSLVLRVLFRDGDGDLGLRSNETDERLSVDFIPEVDEQENYIVYDPQTHGTYDCTEFRPPPSYDGLIAINDTIRGTYNPDFYNFDVTILRKEDQEFVAYDWRRERCSAPLGGRFPPLREDLSVSGSMEGVLQFGFRSAGIRSFFRNDTVRLAVQIKDRALNASNTIESRAFTLQNEGVVYVE